ncbi:MAG: 50S ribosomal protein L9 [Candidatus Omnitrophota bacterium]|nr:50S ribosomal protein L9 [Candidatus Omnitrophota bacterium]
MEIILTEDVGKLGKSGDVVKVKDGYARNFLIPKKLAFPITPQNLKIAQHKKKLKFVKKESEKLKAVELAEKLAAVSCTIPMPVGENDKLFGIVTGAHISEAFETEGVSVDKKKIEIAAPIKKLGVFTVFIKLHPEVTQKVKIWVVKE